MARRSLYASVLGIEKAKRAFKRTEWTQEYLASEVGLETRQSIWKFFTGKPIDRQNFMEICFQLGLNWQEIAELPTESPPTENKQDWDNCWDINSLMQLARSRVSDKIQAQCSTIQLLDIAQASKLEDIYVSVNISNNITGQKWLDISELQVFDREELNYFGLGQVYQERVPAMQAVATYSKLIMLGKPGSGKTTFLKHIAIQCNQGKFLQNLIPIFIRLKNFAEDTRKTGNLSLLKYASQELSRFGASDEQIKKLLYHGKVLFLLDGLDEIPDEDSSEIVKQICNLSEEYYKNHLVITCRIATQQYQFEGFTDIEIVDFDSSQIEAFVQKWFTTVGRNSQEKGKTLATQFMQKLQLSENRQFRELAVTPLLLNLLCAGFQAHSDFPARRAELYKQGLDILLNRWDKARSIQRDQIERQLSLPRKLKLLSQIAAITFEQGHYFFAQSNLQDYITDYLRNLSTAETEPEVLQLNSEAVLNLLKSQGLLVEQARGIFSFSFRTFHEYLTARNIVDSPESQILEEKLLNLSAHLTEPRWRKVFLLTANMLGNAAYLLLLMKQRIDTLVAFDEQLQQFLVWLHQKSVSVEAPYKSVAIRAFYLTLVLSRDVNLAPELSVAIDPKFAGNLAPDLAMDRDLNRVLSLIIALPCDPSVDQILALRSALPDDQAYVCDSELQSSLQQLKGQLPALARGRLKEWWKAFGSTWVEKLKNLILRGRNIGAQWHFSRQQKEVLKQYYPANQLLVDCLKSSYELTSTEREKIESTLLLPLATTALHKGSMKCPECQSTQISRNGHRRDRQAYVCKHCNRQFLESYLTQGYSDAVKQLCLKMHDNGMSFRAIERVTNISHNSVINWVKLAGGSLPDC